MTSSSSSNLKFNYNPETEGCTFGNIDLTPHYSYRKWPLPKYIMPGSKSGKRFYRTVGDGTSTEKHNHEIWFRDDGFTVDGEFRLVNDPKNLPILESLNNCECPEEFSQPGEHCISVYGDLSFDKEAFMRKYASTIAASKIAASKIGGAPKNGMGGRLMGNNVNF